jgi:hypothetical protein
MIPGRYKICSYTVLGAYTLTVISCILLMDSHDADEALNEDELQTLPAEGNACTSSCVQNSEGKNQYQHCHE